MREHGDAREGISGGKRETERERGREKEKLSAILRGEGTNVDPGNTRLDQKRKKKKRKKKIEKKEEGREKKAKQKIA